MKLGLSLEGDVVFGAWLVLVIFWEVFCSVKFHEGMGVTLPDEVFEPVKSEPYFIDI
jgi:hypothetical protein